MSDSCIGCNTSENLIHIEEGDEVFIICKQCNQSMDDEIKQETTNMTTQQTESVETPERYSDIEGHQVFVIGSPSEIKTKQRLSKSKLEEIQDKVSKIKAGMARDKMYLTRKQNKLDKIEPELIELKSVSEANGFLKKKEFEKAELFGVSADGELRIKIDGKWFNENLQEFAKVEESKMTRKMVVSN